jgi:glycosyltransferase involved in cell wall biosynthesis
MTGQRVVYVALGRFRVRAAAVHAGAMAARGDVVRLVIPDSPDWADLTVADPVRVHRVPAAGALRAARRLVLEGDLASTDLVVAGDLAAVPVAFAASRQGVPVRLEPAPDPHRRPAPADLAVVTPWYPSPNDPFYGAFVRAMLLAVRERFDRVSVLHPEVWSFPAGSTVPPTTIGLMAERIAGRWGNAVVTDEPEGELCRVAVPVLTRGRPYARLALSQVEQLRAGLPGGQIEAPVVHAHTGIYGGVVATRLARPDARVVVTEHATFLPQVLADAAARRLYDEMAERADGLLCVSRHLHDLLLATYPQHRSKLAVVSNVIEFADFPPRPAPPADLLRWLYVGRLAGQKRVPLLVEAFARVAAAEPAATLTLVGSGEGEDEVRARVAELGLTDRVSVRAPVPPDEVGPLLHRHDLLVHASDRETFGLTVVEAVATGTPVLVARSEGPAETMAGLDGVAGAMFDVSDDPQVIVTAFERLRARRDALDLPAARRTMRDRYDVEHVAAALAAVLRPPAAAETAATATGTAAAVGRAAPPGAAGRVLVVAVSPPNVRHVRTFANQMVADGHTVDLVTADELGWRYAGLDPAVRVFELGPAERRRPLPRGEWVMVFAAPARVLGAVRSFTRRRAVLWPEVATAAVQRGHDRWASRFHRLLFQRAYQIVRPRLLWRVFRRRVLPALHPAGYDHVVVSGATGVRIAWKLSRRWPAATVTTALTAPAPAPVDDGAGATLQLASSSK